MIYPKDQLLAVDLTNQAVYDAIISYLRENIIYSDFPQLLKDIDFIEQWWPLHPTFSSEYPERAAEIKLKMIEAAWIALPAHTKPEQTIVLFHQHLNVLFALQDRYEIPRADTDIAKDYLTERLRERLVEIPRFADRDAFKKELYQALITNEEIITTAQFFRSLRETPPTTKMWFSEYIEFMSSEEFIERRFQLFFEQNENAQRLNVDEKAKLQLLFKAYEQLRLSSWKETGIEEEVDIEANAGGKTGKIIYGKVYLDDPKLKEQYTAGMKNYRDLLVQSGAYSSIEMYDLEPRPAVATVTADMTKGYVKPDGVTGPNIAATKGPDHFTEQDEDEIKLHEALLPLNQSDQNQYIDQVNQLKQHLSLSFSTAEEEKRFTDLVTSVLRGLRDIMEFQQYLVDLAYPANQVINITAAVRDLLGSRSVAPVRKRRTPASAQTPTVAQLQGQSQGTETTATTPFGVTGVAEPTTTTASQPKAFLPKLRRSRITKKPLIDDVKLQPSMVMGPIDELRAMDALEFRRLSPNPMQAALHIKDKIDLLAEESVAKQAEGIHAFKASPLNTMYLELGNQSITTGQPVNDLIAQLESRGTPTLSVVEFNAIADLNKQLRF